MVCGIFLQARLILQAVLEKLAFREDGMKLWYCEIVFYAWAKVPSPTLHLHGTTQVSLLQM